MTKAL
jgi:hypothetical protein